MPLMAKRSVVIVLIGGAALGLFWLFRHHSFCGVDVQKYPINGTQFVVLTEVSRCSAVDGSVTVSALDTKTNKKEEIAFMDEESIPTVRIVSSTEVELTFENLVDIVRSKSSFGPVSVSYHFIPKDDPEARRRYQFWMHHPNDPQAIRWSEEHFKNSP